MTQPSLAYPPAHTACAANTATMHPTLRRSFIEYDSDCEFPLQNLPWGIFSTADNVCVCSF